MEDSLSDLDRIVDEVSALVRKSEYQRLREYIQNLIIIGRCDSVLSQKIMDEQ